MRVAFLLAVLAVTLPDLRTGNVNGLTGILFWPAHPNKPNGDPDPWESADGCVVHAVPHNDRDRELLYPCGKWFVLPEAGPFNYWLESDGQMTPTIGLFIHAHKPFNGGGLGSIVPLTPAGRISIPPDALWLDGVKLYGPPLVFATWSAPATNPSGIWIGRNLPAKAINVLVAPYPEITSNTHDALAKRIDYPWPAPKN